VGGPTLEDESGITLAGDAGTSLSGGSRGTLAAGSSVGRYVVLASVGVGGMGVVYAAYDPELDRKVALKLLQLRPSRDESLGRARLLREAQALARLSHPNVVAVHDVGTFEGRVFVAMEFVSGKTLGRWLGARPRSRAEVLDVLAQAGRGLAAAHAAGLVHRDFKPENVMVRDDGRVSVMDFGVARPAGARPTPAELEARTEQDADRTLDLTATGALVGTPAYMAPEQHLGLAVDARTDQFAFCVTAYEALYGHRPFRGDSLAAVAYQVSQGLVRDAPPRSGIPARLRRVLLRGLSVDPAARHPSMDGLLSALARAGKGRGRRIGVVAAAATILVGAIAGPHVLEGRDRARCRSAADEIAATWDQAARARVDAGVRASGLDAPDEILARVTPWLDGYADAWWQTRHDVCMATPDASAELSDAGVACLEERADALAVMVDAIADGDREVVLRAVQAASGLPPVAACRDPRRLLAQAAAPADEATRGAVRELRRELERARTLAAAGRYGPAEEVVREVAERAATVGYAPLQAEISLALARVLERRAEYTPAVEAYDRAFSDALAVGHDEIAAQAAGGLVYVIGARLSDAGRATTWERIARGLLQRIDATDGLEGAALANSAGTVHFFAGEYDEAQVDFDRALELRETILGLDHPDVASTLNNLGILSLVRGNYDAALGYHGRALAIREHALGPRHPEVAQSRGNRGNVRYAKGDPEGALADYRVALEVAQVAFGPEHPDVAMNLNNIGNALDNAGDKTAALEHYARALAIREKVLGPEHPMVAQTLHNIAIVERRLDRFEDARQRLERALAIKEKALGPQHPTVAPTRVELGRVLVALNRALEGVAQLERAVKIAQEAGGDAAELAEARHALALALVAAGRDDARVVELARQARDGFAGDDHRERREEVERFLAERGPPPPSP
jgi:tetratricopeptide (TPR) repeat protein